MEHSFKTLKDRQLANLPLREQTATQPRRNRPEAGGLRLIQGGLPHTSCRPSSSQAGQGSVDSVVAGSTPQGIYPEHTWTSALDVLESFLIPVRGEPFHGDSAQVGARAEMLVSRLVSSAGSPPFRDDDSGSNRLSVSMRFYLLSKALADARRSRARKAQVIPFPGTRSVFA